MYGRIYKITCLIDNKIYIGQTIKTIEERFREHIKTSKNQKQKNSYLYNAMRKYGIENFKIEEIEICNSKEELDEREKYWILFLQTQNNEIGYNIHEGGSGGITWNGNRTLTEKQLEALEYGRHLPSSEKQKQTLSQNRKNIIVSDKTKSKIKIARQKQVFTDETRQKMSEAHKGKKLPKKSAESIERIRKSSSDRVHIHKGNQNKNPKREDLQIYLDNGWELGYYYDK